MTSKALHSRRWLACQKLPAVCLPASCTAAGMRGSNRPTTLQQAAGGGEARMSVEGNIRQAAGKCGNAKRPPLTRELHKYHGSQHLQDA